jgi:hypothetical protein
MPGEPALVRQMFQVATQLWARVSARRFSHP